MDIQFAETVERIGGSYLINAWVEVLLSGSCRSVGPLYAYGCGGGLYRYLDHSVGFVAGRVGKGIPGKFRGLPGADGEG